MFLMEWRGSIILAAASGTLRDRSNGDPWESLPVILSDSFRRSSGARHGRDVPASHTAPGGPGPVLTDTTSGRARRRCSSPALVVFDHADDEPVQDLRPASVLPPAAQGSLDHRQSASGVRILVHHLVYQGPGEQGQALGQAPPGVRRRRCRIGGRVPAGEVACRIGQAPSHDGAAMDEQRQVGGDTDTRLHRRVQDRQVPQADQLGCLGIALQDCCLRHAEVAYLGGTEPAPAGRKPAGDADSGFRGSGFVRQVEPGGHQLAAFLVEPEVVLFRPQPLQAAEGGVFLLLELA